MSDGRVNFVEKDEAPGEVAKIYEGVEAKFCMIPNIIKTLGHTAEGLETMGEMLGMSQSFQLKDKYGELAYLKESTIRLMYLI